MNTLSLFTPRFTSDLFDVIDRNFSDFEQKEKNRIPAVDLYETKDSYVLKMELSGYTQDDVELNIKDKVLTIKSVPKTEEKKSTENKEKGQSSKEDKAEQKDVFYHIQEIKTTYFARSFNLPEDIDEENVQASMKNGLLTVEIKRKAKAEPKKIIINVA